MANERITAAEMHFLRQNETFQKLMALMNTKLAAAAKSVLSGNSLKGETGATIESYARNVGKIEGLRLFLEFEGEKEEN